jgi:hypothetical protein
MNPLYVANNAIEIALGTSCQTDWQGAVMDLITLRSRS